MNYSKYLADAYRKKAEIKTNLFNISEQVLKASADLRRAKADIINTTKSKDLGGNDKERDARISFLTQEEMNILEDLETQKRRLDLAYQLACDAIELLHWQIRAEQVEPPVIPMCQE